MKSKEKHTTPGVRWSSSTQLLVWLRESYVSGVRGVKKQGVSGSKNGCLFASVSAVRFKETVKPAGSDVTNRAFQPTCVLVPEMPNSPHVSIYAPKTLPGTVWDTGNDIAHSSRR
jgi:hypothetical protein